MIECLALKIRFTFDCYAFVNFTAGGMAMQPTEIAYEQEFVGNALSGNAITGDAITGKTTSGRAMSNEERSVFQRLLATIKSSQNTITTQELFEQSIALPRVCKVQSTRVCSAASLDHDLKNWVV
jgi:hypothetical protein